MCLVHLSFLPWELIVHLLVFLGSLKVEDVLFLSVKRIVDLAFNILTVNKVLIFIMMWLLRLIYILSVSYNLLLIIRMKEIRYQVPFKILFVDIINRDQVIIQTCNPWGTIRRLFLHQNKQKTAANITFLFFHFTKRIFLLFP